MPPLINLIGQRFNNLLVIERASNIGRYTAWKCKCDCGKECVVRGADLKNNHTKSCGCLKIQKTQEKFYSQAINHIREKYGHLTILEVTDKRTSDRHILYKCQCDCEQKTIIYKPLKDLKNGHTVSCGCLISKGEEKIKNLLLQNNILFEQQKTFDNCRFLDTGALAKFDFYVDNKYIIEFDGKQHFISYESGWSNKELLAKTKDHDNYKNNWCHKNNVPIIRIPYIHLENIQIQDLLLKTTNYLVKD